MQLFLEVCITALYTIFVQNLVITGAFGASEAVRVAAKPRRFLLFAGMLTYFSLLTSIACYFLDFITPRWVPESIWHIILYGLALVGVFLLTLLLLRMFVKPSGKFISTLGVAAINSLVFAVPMLNRQLGYSLLNCIACAVGAGVSFVLAAALIGRGMQHIENNENIPQAFRGTPALLLYVSLISLAFLGLTDSSIFA